MLGKKQAKLHEWIDVDRGLYDTTIITKYYFLGFRIFKSTYFKKNSFEKEKVENKAYEQ